MATELKNVLVIGLGLGGAPAAKELARDLPATHRVVAISEKSFAFFPVASLRAAVVPSWEDKITAPYSKLFQGQDSRHVILDGTKVLELGVDHVIVDRVHEGFSTRIDFDYVVIASGSTYAFPMRPTTTAVTEDDVRAQFKKLQVEVAAAKSVLIVGGGPTGIEMAGEIKEAHPSIEVTLVASDEALLTRGYKPKLGASLKQQLLSLGVKIIFGQRADTRGLETGPIEKQAFVIGEETITADYLFLGYGCSPNSAIVKALDVDLIDAAGRVKVSPTLQLVSSDGKYDKLFAVGDVTNIAEEKISVYAAKHAVVAAANIVALVKGKAPTKTYAAGGVIILVVLTSKGGAGQLFGFVVGAWVASFAKSGHLFVSQFNSTFNKVAV